MTESSLIATLKIQARKLNFSKLRAKEDNKSANSGEQAYKDINRMDFVINGKDVNRDFINQLYKKHTGLIENNKDGEKNYRLFAKEVFKEMFKYAGAAIPSNPILEELVTNCNQAGYESAKYMAVVVALNQHSFMPGSPERVMKIDCTDQNNVRIRSDLEMPIYILRSNGKLGGKACDLSGSLECTLESQGGKDGVTYRDGKLSLAIPKELKNHQNGDKSLFDIIKEYFQKFCEILGFACEAKIKHNLGDQLKVDTHLENVELSDHEKSHFFGD